MNFLEDTESEVVKILIVDSSRLAREVHADMLEDRGYEIRMACDGEEAVKVTKEFEPDLILMDIVMPVMDGLESCEKIRALNFDLRPAVLMVSSISKTEVIAASLEKGADDFIIKPFKEAELLARVDAQLRIRRFYMEVARDKRNLEIILDVTKAVSSTLDSDEVLRIAVDKLAEVTGATRCSIMLVAENDVGYVLASNDRPELKEFKVDLAKYPEVQEAIRTKNLLIVENMGDDPLMHEIQDLLRGFEGMSVMVVPITFHEEVLGTLFLKANRMGKGFGSKDITLCRIVANATYPALRNARVYDSLKKESEEALKQKVAALERHKIEVDALNETLRDEIKVRRTVEDQLSVSLHEKEILIKEIHHRVKNNLQVISSLLQIKSSGLATAEEGIQLIKNVLDDCQASVRSMAIIHDRLHNSSDLSSVDFSECIETVSREIVDIHGDPDRVAVCFKGGHVYLGIDQAIPCSLAVTELITNALKHAFPDGRKGTIDIEVSEDSSGMVMVKVSDNGVGISEDIDWRNPTSIGLGLVNGLLSQINGAIDLLRSEGSLFTISFRKELSEHDRVVGV